MSVSLQTSGYMNDDQPNSPWEMQHDPLRMEHGWRTVSQGLGRILIGHFMFIGACMVSGVIFYLAYVRSADWDPTQEATGFTPDLIFFFGIMLLGLFSIVSYFVILSGKWTCAANTPDRLGAKWMIFACIVCLILGPAMSIATSLVGSNGSAEAVKYNPETEEVELTVSSSQTIMQIFGTVVGLVGSLFFVLFLRGIALCFDNHFLRSMVDGYIVMSATTLGFTLQLGFSIEEIGVHSPVLILLGLAWLVMGGWYLLLVLLAKVVVHNGMEKVKAPILG